MSTYEHYFEDADAPWMPKLIDIEYAKVQTDDPDKAAYYSQFGWDALDHDASSDPGYESQYPHINARWDVLTRRFNQKYAYRMVSIETLEHWQNNLQTKFDEVADKYERAYALYEEYSSQMMDDVLDGERETVEETNQASGTDTSNGTAKNWDTPDSAINADADYADNVDVTNGSTTYGRKDTHDIERVRVITGKNILDNINASIRDWKDIDTEFVAEFEPLFLNVLWY